jgi:hypothetical protein
MHLPQTGDGCWTEIQALGIPVLDYLDNLFAMTGPVLLKKL